MISNDSVISACEEPRRSQRRRRKTPKAMEFLCSKRKVTKNARNRDKERVQSQGKLVFLCLGLFTVVSESEMLCSLKIRNGDFVNSLSFIVCEMEVESLK